MQELKTDVKVVKMEVELLLSMLRGGLLAIVFASFLGNALGCAAGWLLAHYFIAH